MPQYTEAKHQPPFYISPQYSNKLEDATNFKEAYRGDLIHRIMSKDPTYGHKYREDLVQKVVLEDKAAYKWDLGRLTEANITDLVFLNNRLDNLLDILKAGHKP